MRNRPKPVILPLMLLGLVLEALLVPMVYLPPARPFLAPVHVMAVGILWACYSLRLSFERHPGDLMPDFFYGLILITFFPVIGLPAALLFFLAVRGFGFTMKSGIFEDYEKYILEKSVVDLTSQSITNLLRYIREEVSFEPLTDIMMGRQIRMKTKAIAKLAQTFSRPHVRLLRAATRDTAPEIRLHAANALLKMENQMHEKIQKALKTAKRLGSPRAHADLGDLCRIYSEIGILNQELSRYYLQMSVEAYRSSLDLETDQPEVIVHYARCLLELGQFERAGVLLERAAEIWPQDAEIVFLRNRAYFHLGKFEGIPDFFRVLDAKELEGREKEVCAFWTNPA